MQENFRQFLDRLRQTGDLVDLHQPVDIRHIATLVDQAKTALFFHNVIGYDMPVVSGIIRSRERAIMALGCETYREIEDKLQQAIDRPIPPKYLKTSPTREVVLVGRRRRSLQAADPDVLDLRRRADDHRRRGDHPRPRVRHQQRHLPLHRQGEEPHRHRHRHPQQYAHVRAARLRAGPPVADLHQHRHPSDRDHRLRLSGAARAWTRWRSRAACAARRSSSRPARPSICPTSPMPRSCWRRKSCRPAGPGRKAASASSRG